jgi:hypothetical protein
MRALIHKQLAFNNKHREVLKQASSANLAISPSPCKMLVLQSKKYVIANAVKQPRPELETGSG